VSNVKHILLPIDFSPRTLAAVRYAAAIARRFRSSLTLIHALVPINIAWEAAGGDEVLIEQILVNQRDHFERKLQFFLADELQDFEVNRVLLEGDPAPTIVNYARSKNIDLILMPTRGGEIFRRFLLGSVAAKILHDAPCPVLTTVHEEEILPDPDVQLQDVLCAVDPGTGDEQALQWACNVASRFKARLSIVHAIPSRALHPETYYLESDMGRVLAGDARDRIMKMLTACSIAEPAIYIQSGPAARVIRSVAQDHRVDLVVIGRPFGTGTPGRLRADSYGIIRESPCPVVSV
jgi:nucleotide-binding universal stress UspA family protein